MKVADVANIPTKGFERKWWEDHRALSAKGSGVGKALDAWNKAGLPPKGNLNNFNDPDQYEAAFEAIDKLYAALKVARGKAKSSKETILGIDKYVSEVAKHEASLKERYNVARTAYRTAREELVRRTKAHLDADLADLKQIEAAGIQAASAEKAATTAAKAGRKDELERYGAQVESLLEQAVALQNAMEARGRREGPYELAEKQKTPAHWGVMDKDGKALNHLFQAAGQNIFACTTASHNADAVVERIRDHLDAIRNFDQQARMDVAEWITLTTDLANQSDKLIDEANGLGVKVNSAKRSTNNLQKMLTTPLDPSKLELAKVTYQAVQTQVKSAPRHFNAFKKLLNQRERMPSEFENHPQVAKAVKRLADNFATAETQMAEIDRLEKLAAKAYTGIEQIIAKG